MELATTSSLNKLLMTLHNICNAHYMRPSFGYGSTEDINASNNIFFPAVWAEPAESKSINTDQGVRVEELTLNIYSFDRIDKGDSNFQELHSDMKYLLQTILAFVREDAYLRNNFISLSRRDGEFRPVTRWDDENTNGWMCKMVFRMPVVYNPCNVPIGPIQQPCKVTYVLPNYVDCGYVN